MELTISLEQIRSSFPEKMKLIWNKERKIIFPTPEQSWTEIHLKTLEREFLNVFFTTVEDRLLTVAETQS